jgi:hypothetical protein
MEAMTAGEAGKLMPPGVASMSNPEPHKADGTTLD